MPTRNKQFGLHLDDAMLEQLQRVREQYGVPMTEFCRRAIAVALAKLPALPPPVPKARSRPRG